MIVTNKLIESFVKGHQMILSNIGRAQQNIRSYNQAYKDINELSEVLLTHWERQSEQFFILLKNFYKEDRESLKMLEFLIYDLKEIKISYLVFADKYIKKNGCAQERSFPKDFDSFCRSVISRLNIEEEYLLPLMKKIADNSKV